MQARTSLHHRLSLALQLILLIGLALAVVNRQWLAAAATAGILVITLLPFLLGRKLNVYIPPELEALAILFVFASLFLGNVRGFYERFWWWDLVLHAASGFLLGIFGFLLVYVLNEKEEIELHMKPLFVALFAFMFSVGLGAIWEIFEFAMDVTLRVEMQHGLTDTMADLIVDTVGAAVIAVLGYGYLQTTEVDSFLERWIARAIERK
ncbi:MAG TPA: hypothetical protein VFV54_00220 [Thermoanaerobaculia bacterium]|nr:hypothetical protein [Thermoanaerobaculia bacterium]